MIRAFWASSCPFKNLGALHKTVVRRAFWPADMLILLMEGCEDPGLESKVWWCLDKAL